MNRGKALMALTVVVLALVAALYVIPSFAHPYWLGEEEGEEFVPPCWDDDDESAPPSWGDGEYNGTNGYPPEWCPWWNSTDGQPPDDYRMPWYNPNRENGEAPPKGYGPGNGGGMMWSRGGNGRGGYGAGIGGRGYRRGCS